MPWACLFSPPLQELQLPGSEAGSKLFGHREQQRRFLEIDQARRSRAGPGPAVRNDAGDGVSGRGKRWKLSVVMWGLRLSLGLPRKLELERRLWVRCGDAG